MAIKRKSRSRPRGGVTKGPRPVYAPVKRPLRARRSFQITAILLVALVAAGGIWYGVAKERASERAKERRDALAARERIVVTRYQGAVDPALSKVGNKLAPSGFSVLPKLATDLEGLRKGNVSVKTAGQDAVTAAQSAGSAVGDLSKIKPANMFGSKGLGAVVVRDGLNSHSKMLNALKLYETAAQLVRMATEATGSQRSELLDRASSVLDVASTVFQSGYNDYLNVQYSAGIFVPTPVGGGTTGG
jgi:hypothetical protein